MMSEGSGPSPFFTRHARAYATSERHARGGDLAVLIEGLGVRPGQRAVDVATGTGHTALALARIGLSVVGVDPTPAMLAEARLLADAERLSDRVGWVEGRAERLPLPEASWDVAVCRRAAHHFSDPAAAVREMARVVVPGGRVGLSDLCPSPREADALNRIERLRDPTHVAALTESAWRALFTATGLRVVRETLRLEPMTFEEWLSPVPADSAEGRACRGALADLPAPLWEALTGGVRGGWLKRRLVLIAERPAA
jgi:SAM-dependent methyltransferase